MLDIEEIWLEWIFGWAVQVIWLDGILCYVGYLDELDISVGWSLGCIWLVQIFGWIRLAWAGD